MTVSVVQTGHVSGAGTTPITLNFASNVQVGNSVVVWIGDYNTSGTAISSVAPTYNGGSVTGAAKLLESQQVGTDRMYFAVWLLPNVQSAGTSVSITAPANGNHDANSNYYIAEVSGLGASPSVDSASPNPATASSNGSANPSSGATGNATGTAGGIVLGGMMQDALNGTWTAPAGWTTLTPESYCGASYQIFSSSGSSYTWNITLASSQWSAGAVILDAQLSAGTVAAAAIPPPPLPPHPYFTTRLLEEAYQRADWQAQGVADLTVTFSSTASGVDTYTTLSPWNVAVTGPQAQHIRVLKPTGAANTAYPHAFLIMLPVDADQGTTFGDPIAVAQSLDVNDTYNLTVVQPGYALHGAANVSSSWYGDNPLDPGASEEKFTLLVLNWMKANLATTGQEQVYLIGFSRSGLAAQFLQFRHPYLFAAAASWDSPFSMTDYDGTDPFGFVGGHPENVFGTDVSFQTKYQLTPAHLAAWQATGQYGTNRIWIGQGPDFPLAEINAYDAALTTAGIPHTYTFADTGETHAWHTDWVAAALSVIIPSNEPTVLPQAYASHPVFTRLLEVAGARIGSGSQIAVVPAGLAAGTGTALPPVPVVTAAAGLATGSGAALAPSAAVTATSTGIAAGTGTALQPVPVVTVLAGLATGTGAALQPSVSTSGSTTANAGLATGTGAALGPAVEIDATSTGLATGTGAALAPVPVVTALPGLATGTGAALQPSVSTSGSVTANAGLATGTGAALSPVPAVTPSAGLATATGTALNAARPVPAGLATGTGAALTPAPAVTVFAGLATAAGAALSITVAAQHNPGTVTVTDAITGTVTITNVITGTVTLKDSL